MKILLASAALLGFSLTAASACEFQKSVKVQSDTVASVEQTPMSTVDSVTTATIASAETVKPAGKAN